MTTNAVPDRDSNDSGYQGTQTPGSNETIVWFGITLLVTPPVLVFVLWFVLAGLPSYAFLVGAIGILAVLLVIGSAFLLRPWGGP